MAWPTTRQPTDILTGEGVPQLWSARMLEHTKSGLVALQVCDSTWGAELKLGDYLYITLSAELTVADVDVSSDAVLTAMAANTFFGSNTHIVIDMWKECPVGIDDSAKKQTQIPGLLEKKAQDAAYAWNKTLDAAVTSLFSTLTSTWAGSDGQTFTDDLLLDIMEGLDEADIPEDGSLVGDPSVIADMRKIDKFMTFDYTTSPLRAAGYRGRVDAYDLPVFYTNNLTALSVGNYCSVLHKDAIGIALQSPMDVESWREPRRHLDVINTSGFYGVDVLRSTFGAYFYSRNK